MRDKILDLLFSWDKTNIRLAIMLNESQNNIINFNDYFSGLSKFNAYNSLEKFACVYGLTNALHTIVNWSKLHILQEMDLTNIHKLKKVDCIKIKTDLLDTLPNKLPPNLTSIIISGRDSNKQFTHIPQTIVKHKQLETLALESCKLERWPKNINNLVHLKMLNMFDIDIKSLNGLELYNLEKLTINCWRSKNFSNIEKFTNLKQLALKCVKVNNSEFLKICALKNLKFLKLKTCFIKNIPKQISNLQNLVAINLSDNMITKIPDEFYKLKALEEINIFMCSVEKISREIMNLKKLKNFNCTQYNSRIHIPKEIDKKVLPKNMQSNIKFNKYVKLY